ncbi:DUF4062 domain-containing protein [Pseudomonas fluorescens]|uniref:DUF4062 domain-containing protein n=1 Tax=Pseudomonas fluorescens TaxID=294 RepID=A0A7Z3C413_PSEFL|nr:DUF4062 domain-containing protein [Pseudomonas fluorescens]QJP95106.1 hypothetical protein C6Y56_10995 [Pseudomonas fluorescens]
MSSKYQIFISSTYVDLKSPRDLVIKAVLEMGHIPVGMEMFSAADEQQWSIIKRQIDQSDYYVVILAHRYGSVTGEGISYTEKEYDYAVSKGIPILGFVLDSGAMWPAKHTETEAAQVLSLGQFRNKVKSRPVSFWKNNDDLYGKCSIALMKAFTAYPREGWIRASQHTDTLLTNELTRLSSENAKLREQLEKVSGSKDESRAREEKKNIQILKSNKREIFVFKKGGADWELATEADLLSLFLCLAPEMLVEISTSEIAEHAAVVLCGIPEKDLRDEFPVPTNAVKEWMADFATLGLVKPSEKKKPIKNTNEYWTLAEQGKSILGAIRRAQLELAVADDV